MKRNNRLLDMRGVVCIRSCMCVDLVMRGTSGVDVEYLEYDGNDGEEGRYLDRV